MSQAGTLRRRLALPLSRRQLTIDVIIAAAAFALSLAIALAHHPGDPEPLDAVAVVLLALACLPLVAWRRRPLTVLVIATAASATFNALGYPLGPPIGPTVALFFVASAERTRDSIQQIGAVVLGLFAIHIGVTAIGEDGFPLDSLLFGILVWGAAFVIGDQVRERRRHTAELRERAERAEREGERERRLAAAEERTRIARDLHDSAGHAINVILVQAGAARLLQDRDARAVRSALETIEEVARETIGEIDQLVRTLRDKLGPEEPVRSVEPAPGLAALETIARQHRAAGLAVTVNVRGASRPLPPAVDQAAYRILQEALTNAARYGLGDADVDVTFDESALQLTVMNATRPVAAPAGGGLGIVGMRERASTLGGSLEADHQKGVFSVRVRLPYGGEKNR